jgi:hypothetical protein
MRKLLKGSTIKSEGEKGYAGLLTGVSELLEQARHAAARSVNAIITATYWEIGRRIVEFEQKGEKRADYGRELLKRLSKDLSARFGRGFSERNLELMRLFYISWPISQTASAKFLSSGPSISGRQKSQTVSGFFPPPADVNKSQTPSDLLLLKKPHLPENWAVETAKKHFPNHFLWLHLSSFPVSPQRRYE